MLYSSPSPHKDRPAQCLLVLARTLGLSSQCALDAIHHLGEAFYRLFQRPLVKDLVDVVALVYLAALRHHHLALIGALVEAFFLPFPPVGRDLELCPHSQFFLEEGGLTLGHRQPLHLREAVLRWLLGRLDLLLLLLLILLLTLLRRFVLHLPGRIAMGRNRIPWQARVIADASFRGLAQSSEPPGQFKIILGGEHGLHVNIELQPSLVEHFLHQVEVGGAVVLRHRRGVVLEHRCLLGKLGKQHLAKENPVPQFLKLVAGVRLDPVGDLLPGEAVEAVGHLVTSWVDGSVYNYLQTRRMINRLAAESTLKVPLRGNAYFSISKKLMCFQGEGQLRVRALSREAKDIEVPFNSAPLRFSLSQHHSWLYELTHNHLLQVYQLEYVNGLADGSFKKIAILHNVEHYSEIRNGLAIVAQNKTLKVISFAEMQEATEVNLNIDANALKSVTETEGAFTLTVSPASQRVLVTRGGKQEQQQGEAETLTECFDRVPSTTRYQKSSSLTYLGQPLALYRDRYAFQRKFEREVEIFDIEQSRLIGKFSLQGSIKLSEVRENLLLVIANRDQTDYFHFFVLHPEPTNLQPLITNRVVYEKSKGDYYRAFNLLSNEASAILDKKKGADIPDTAIAKLSDNTSTILYALNRAKEKVEIIKVEHSKLLKSPFGEERLDKIVYSKKGGRQEEVVEVERARVYSSIELKAGEKSMEEMQRKFVEGLIDIKLKGVMRKFQELEKKVEQLERLIRGINQKVESNLAKINRDEIRQNVEKLFDSLTPQFEKYFSEIFKQVAGVLDQGVTYYNMKLAKEADLHKDALTQIVTETFKATEDIVQLARREQAVTEKTEEHLRSILEAKKKWKKSTEDYESKLKEVPSPNLKSQGKAEPKPEGKVFVRADLNFTSGKRQG